MKKEIESTKKSDTNSSNAKSDGKKSLASEGEIPRFAFTEETLSTKIEIPDLDNLDNPIQNESDDEPVLDIKEKRKITRERVHEVWANYVEKLKKDENISGEMLFKDREIEIHTEQEFIVIHFENRVQLDSFEELKTELMYYLRQNLSNPDLKITVEVKKQENDSKRLYTDQDKLNFLIEKNPIVKELKDKLGLDVDY